MPSDPMQDLIEAAKALEPYLDAIICYASTMEEHEPNRLAFNLRSALSNAETHLPALKAAGGWRPSREEVATCKTCKHFDAEDRQPPFGSCARWHRGYRVELSEVATDEVLVEDDEGWAAIMGPDFGCVLHERADSTLALGAVPEGGEDE